MKDEYEGAEGFLITALGAIQKARSAKDSIALVQRLERETTELEKRIETLKADEQRKRRQITELDVETEKRRQQGLALESKYSKLVRLEELEDKISELEARLRKGNADWQELLKKVRGEAA
jgi:chromosome segregation ATPase